MFPVQNGIHNSEIQEEEHQRNGSGMKLGDYIPIYIPAIERSLFNQSGHEKEKRFLDFLKARPSNEWFLRVLRRNTNQPEDPTTPVSTTDGGGERRRFRVPFVRKINWGALWKSFKKWIRSPEHIALFIWLIVVAAGLLLLFLVMIGALNGAIPSSSRRKDWEEIINQILNALFTMMALYEHPKLFHHLVLLLRWRPGDEVEPRKIYNKSGAAKPHERAHMLVVVILLHITCFSQYVLCGLYWGYTRTTRPDWAVNTSIAAGIVAPIAAVGYVIYSPLGRRSNEEQQTDAESQETNQEQVEPEAFQQKIVITSPEWIGGPCDCTDDTTVACLSFFCTFCVFGWNMERLGFGNMYVHIFTFVLLCTAPFWVFAISALNVDDDTIKLILVITGSILCVFGLLYGGFWRTEMRKKFKLREILYAAVHPR
ncbi:hypothetical protein HPP92_011684 [Vanilla planifolia]|uniref:Uncharacterized protein n=1 Tax=Vanilla planifolia TaxID=51239 RepID=A0A835R8Y3_VANPL|nr:hypothetical protein HPP92_011684 [Vanilla planifolia]